jgi:hypothetical protein
MMSRVQLALNVSDLSDLDAAQDKVWVRNPDGADREIYTVLGDTTDFGTSPTVDRVYRA